MNLKFIKLTNCLGIEEKEIKVGKVTLIEGESESGKTSIIDSIRKGLKNENVRPIFSKDNKEGIVFLQFDNDLDVTRTVKVDNKTTLKISKDGMSPNAPQTYLNALLGENDFAPIDWLKKTDKEQAEDLLGLLDIKLTKEEVAKIVGEEIDLNYNNHGLVICEELENRFMDIRKDINSDIKFYKANIENDKNSLPAGYNPNKYRDIKLNDLFDAINIKEDINNMIDKAELRIANSKEIIGNLNTTYHERLEDLTKEFERRKQELLSSTHEMIEEEEIKTKTATEYLENNKKVDTEIMRAEAKEIEEGQSYLRMYDKMMESQIALEAAVIESDKHTKTIGKIRELPGKLLDEAKSPIPGMGISGGLITIDGLPIKNLSDGAKMQLAIKIAKETSRDLKLILLNGFEQLNWSLQKEMFKEMQNDEYQYIITKVNDGELSISHIKDNQIINTETGEIINI